MLVGFAFSTALWSGRSYFFNFALVAKLPLRIRQSVLGCLHASRMIYYIRMFKKKYLLERGGCLRWLFFSIPNSNTRYL